MYVPIVAVAAFVFIGLIAYFLRIGLGVTGAALGPAAQQGDSDIRAGDAAAPPAPVARVLEELRRRIARNPQDIAALLALGDLYADAAKLPQAQQYYGRVLRIAPNQPDALFGSGVAAAGLGQRAAAAADFNRYLTAAPNGKRAAQARAALRALHDGSS